MGVTIQADENGALILPPGSVSSVEPGARFSVELQGDDVILRREPGGVDESESRALKIARLRAWVASLPPSPPLPLQATSRDSIYE